MQTVSVVIAAASVVMALVALIQQNREARSMRQTELFMSIYSRYREKEFLKHLTDVAFTWEFKDYDDYMGKYGWTVNLEAHSSMQTVAYFFQAIGVLLKRKQIDVALVDDLMLDGILRFWEKMGSVVKQGRIRENNPRLMVGVEYLYNELVKREQLEPYAISQSARR